MYNIRYHLASLVAVFLALAVGLVLGSIVVERGTLDAQREALVASLQKEYAQLNAENKQLSTQADADAEFLGRLVPYTVRGALDGRTVVVIANAGRTDGLSSARDAITAAGGTACFVVIQTQSMGLDQPEIAAAAAQVLGIADDDPNLLESVAASLAAEWSAPAPRPLTDALEQAGTLRTEALPDKAVSGAVVLASWDKQPDPVALLVASTLSRAGVATVGAEQVGADTGVAQEFAGKGLAAVNDLGTPRGEYSLVRVLSGEVSGYYGTGSVTDAPFAPLPAPSPVKE